MLRPSNTLTITKGNNNSNKNIITIQAACQDNPNINDTIFVYDLSKQFRNNDDWTKLEKKTGKRNLSDFSIPNSPDLVKNKNKKLFVTTNRYKVLQTESGSLPIDNPIN